MSHQPEAFSRVLIDQALTESGWDLLNPRQVRFELRAGARSDQRDAYRIERLPSPADLERQRLKNLQPPRLLLTENVTPTYLQSFRPDIRLHGYQMNAIHEIAAQFVRSARLVALFQSMLALGFAEGLAQSFGEGLA